MILQLRDKLRHLFLSYGECLIPESSSKEGEVRCLYGHHLFDDQVDGFERAIRELKALGDFISLDELIGALDGSNEVKGRNFFLSFDDAFLGVFENALPVLKQQDVPAAVFVPTAFPGTKDEDLEAFRKEAGYSRKVRFPDWSTIRAASGAGFEIGSHTRTHARLSGLEPWELESEILGSKKEIEDRIGKECRAISWPYGTEGDVSETALNLVRGAGYSVCFSAIRGSVNGDYRDHFRIPREHVEFDWPLSHIRFFARGLGDYLP